MWVSSAEATACASACFGFGFEPWSEQKNPCLHLEQVSFEDAAVVVVGPETTGVGVGILGLGAAFVRTGFSVVCLPVLHPGISKNKLKS